jgi:hypothetical protein
MTQARSVAFNPSDDVCWWVGFSVLRRRVVLTGLGI